VDYYADSSLLFYFFAKTNNKFSGGNRLTKGIEWCIVKAEWG